MEDPGDQLAALALSRRGTLALGAQEGCQGGKGGEGKYAPLPVLGRARLQADHPCVEIHLLAQKP